MLFPFRPDWASPYKVTREFATKIFTSRSGKEQRRANRNRPRKQVEFAITLSGDEARAFTRLMQHRVGLDLTLADETRPVPSAGTLADGDSELELSAPPPWLPGGAVLRHGSQVAKATVVDIDGTSATLAEPSTSDWPLGTTVLPALVGRIDPSIKTTLVTDAVIQGTVTLRVNPLSEPPIDPPAATTTFNGRDVFLQKPNWSTAPAVTFSNAYETVDYGYGAVEHFNPIEFVSRAQQATYLGLNPDAVAAIENQFIRAKGQRGEFYVPTWQNDLPPLGTAEAGDDNFVVPGTDTALLNGDTTLRAICVRYRDGSFDFYEVESITADEGNSVVTLTDDLIHDIDASVAAISWMPVHRFASDILTTEWLTDRVAQVQIALVSLEDLP